MRCVCLVLVAAVWLAVGRPAGAQSWDELEAQGAVIAGIEIAVRDVFDVSEPSENNWIGRTGNRLHIDTRDPVVRRELLFAVGDVVNADQIRETERNLRRLAFVRDARVVPERRGDGAWWARVEADDAWSLQGSSTLNRSGGNTTWSLRLDEVNLLGRGKRLFVEHEQNLERTANEVGYIDPQLFNSRWVMSLAYSNLSDGSSRFAFIDRPYFSVDTPYSIGGSVSTNERLLTLYNDGDAVHLIPVRRTSATMTGSRAYRVRDRTAFRVGMSYRADEYEYGAGRTVRSGMLPAPDISARRLRGLSGTWSMVQDRPVVMRNMATIGRTEDYGLGWRFVGGAGYFARALGSLASAPFAEVAVAKGWQPDDRRLILVDAAYSARRETGHWRNALGRAALTAYNGIGGGQTLAAQLTLASSTRPDAVDWLYLGGRDGLRGYVDHFLAGDRTITLSIEDRLITSWRPLGLVQAGFVAYVDAGTIRRADTGRWSRTYANVGGGLRFGSLKSARGSLIQISVAMPIVRDAGLDRLLVVLGNTARF